MDNSKELYGINLPEVEKQIGKSYIDDSLLGCKIVNNGIILPLRKTEIPARNEIYEGGVCDNKFQFIAGYQRRRNKKSNANINFECIRSYKPEENIEYEDEEVIFGGVIHIQFGHFIAEGFNRIWWIIENKEFDKKVVFIKNNKSEPDFLKLIEYTGIKKENIVFLEKPTRFSKIYIPDQSMYFFDSVNRKYTVPYDAIVDNIKLGGRRKYIYQGQNL